MKEKNNDSNPASLRLKAEKLLENEPSNFILSREGEILASNLCGSQIISKKRFILINDMFGFLLADESKPVFNLFLENVFCSKDKVSCEVILSANGNPPMDVTLCGKVSENGEYCLLTLTDITAQKKAEKALTESQELYEDLVSYQSAGIYRVLVKKQEKGKSIIESASIEFVSDRFCELFEVDKNKFLKNAINETLSKIHPEDLQEFIKSNEIAQQSLKSYVWETRLLIDNRIKWLRFESSPRKLENGSIRWTGIAIDISKHKQDEEVIRNNEEKYRLLLELATDAFFQADINGNLIVVNTSAIEQTGFSRDEMVKMNIEDLFSGVTLLEKPLKYDQLRNGEIVKSERELICKDGKAIIVEMNSRMMPDGTFQSFFRDITERKVTEKALKRKLSELEIYYQLAITRERKMIALKGEINLLLKRLGEKAKY